MSTEGLKQTVQGEKAKSSRIGEAFATGIQMYLEDFLMEDDKPYKEALAKKVQNNREVNDKAQRMKGRCKAENSLGIVLKSARNGHNA